MPALDPSLVFALALWVVFGGAWGVIRWRQYRGWHAPFQSQRVVDVELCGVGAMLKLTAYYHKGWRIRSTVVNINGKRRRLRGVNLRRDGVCYGCLDGVPVTGQWWPNSGWSERVQRWIESNRARAWIGSCGE